MKDIVEKNFSKQFSKFEQLSTWIQRPLRKTQLHYAALDAYILLELKDIFKQKDQNWDETILEISDQALIKRKK